jgi:membrane protease subunit (stomatin/prohibitin family)
MGIMSFIKKQFIDVIDWTEDSSSQGSDALLSYRYPMQDQEIQNGGQLTVRESQLALFVNEGKFADQFGPGLHTLNTRTLPILTNLKNWDKAFASPFKSDVYFFSTREQLGHKWGTPQPLTIRDQEFGPIRLRAFGAYSYKLTDPKVFYEKVSGSKESCRVADFEEQLRSGIASQMGATLGTGTVAFIDMAANQKVFGETLKAAMMPFFKNYGLELTSFLVESLSLPEEVQAYLDKASSMRMVGDMGKFTQFQAADAIGAAARNEGGGAAATGVGMGAGVALGQAMAGALTGASNSTASNAAEDPTKTLEKLHGLLKSGILTQAEFDAKKAEILKKI